MSDVKQTVIDQMIAAREQLDALVNAFAPSDDEDEKLYRDLRAASEALTAVINADLARPIAALGVGLEARVAEIRSATFRLKQVDANLAGIKQAIEITDQIIQVAISIVTGPT